MILSFPYLKNILWFSVGKPNFSDTIQLRYSISPSYFPSDRLYISHVLSNQIKLLSIPQMHPLPSYFHALAPAILFA